MTYLVAAIINSSIPSLIMRHINAQNSNTMGKLMGHVSPISIAVKILILSEGSAQAVKVSNAEMTEPIKYTVFIKAHAAGYI
ncbi:hypothetical protein ACUN3I_19050 [Hafnia alvei]|uniref:hypothetical protein n=1 Tax=Hafnia alvei TaxID=569 RepID=UPI004044E75B